MLYVFHGSDTHSSLKKARVLIDSLQAKKPDASYVRVEASQWNPSIIEEHLGGQGLFSKAYIIFLDRVTENTEAKEGLTEFVPYMHESTNIFIVLEEKINAELKKAFDGSADKVVVTEEVKATPKFGSNKNDFNIFALADAVGQRDPFKAWTIYRQAVDSGIETESIVGTLFWQLKSMAVASVGNSAGETGLNPFVYSKAKKAANNYSANELYNLTKKFITMYHDGHRGMVDMELGVERVLLGIGNK